MQFEDHIDALRRESRALSTAARTAGVDAPVPSCPGWTVADLLGHVGRLHRWVTGIVTTRPADASQHWKQIDAPDGDALLSWFDGGYPVVADTLLAAGPDAEAWSWTADRTARFWARRQANEIAVHRWDAQLAAGATDPIDRVLAVDGVNEFFWLIPFWRGAHSVTGSGETLHFHCTDGEGEWLARLDRDRLVVTREHAKGDVAVRGPASELLLLLYGRVDASALDVFGDDSLLARWRELVRW